jgi:hypothetical protein
MFLRARELLVGILQHKGTPEALEEVRVLERELKEHIEVTQAERRAALEEAMAMTLQADRRVRRQGAKRRKEGKGKGRRGRDRRTGPCVG